MSFTVRERMREAAGPHLEPGEVVEEVFSAQTTSQAPLMAVSGALLAAMLLSRNMSGLVVLLYAIAVAGLCVWLVARNRYRIVVATDRRLLVLDAGALTTTFARGVVGEHDRSTGLGVPIRALVWHRVALGGETLRVHRRYFGDIERAGRRP